MNATGHSFVLALLITMLMLTAAPGPASASGNLALAPGDSAPLLRGIGSDGKTLRVDYTKHRFTVVNFWATWCGPCKDEMPALQKLYETHADSGLEIVGVMNDSVSLDAMQKFVDGLGVTYTVARPHKNTGRLWKGVGVLPTTFLIDQRGTVLRRYVGATEEQILGLVDDVEAILDGRPPGPMVIPEIQAIATEADRQRALKEKKP